MKEHQGAPQQHCRVPQSKKTPSFGYWHGAGPRSAFPWGSWVSMGTRSIGRGHRDSVSIATGGVSLITALQKHAEKVPSTLIQATLAVSVASLLEEPHQHLLRMRNGGARGPRCFLSRASTIPSSTHWGAFPSTCAAVGSNPRASPLPPGAAISKRWHQLLTHGTARPPCRWDPSFVLISPSLWGTN